MDKPVPYEFDLVSTDAGIDALATEWTALYLAAGRDNPRVSFEWNRAAWRHLGGGSEPFFLTARRGGRLVGVAPLRRKRQGPFRVLRFAGSGWSPYPAFLADGPDAEAALVAALAATPGWDVAHLLPADARYTRLLDLPLPKGLCARSTFGSVSPYLALGEDWEALL
jgi:CelD/BcsL family acetyltransferase involved in cellulose biosynthesis